MAGAHGTRTVIAMEEEATGGTAPLQLADVNVIVDAAQTIYRAWDACRPLMALSPQERNPDNFASLEAAERTLTKHGHHNLADQVRNNKIPLQLIQARAAGHTLSRSVHTQPPPPWLRSALLNHNDGRVRDLAHAAATGTLVLTTYTLSVTQAVTASRPIKPDTEGARASKIPASDVEGLIHALTHGSHLVSVPQDLPEAIASGTLTPLREEARQYAGEHLAAFPDHDPYWRTPTEQVHAVDAQRPDGMTYREHKARHPDAYGIDGDDLYMIHQARYAAQTLGRTVLVSTSDYHLAHASVALGVPSRLYSYDQGEIRATNHTPHRFVPPRQVNVPGLSRDSDAPATRHRPLVAGRS